MQHHSMATASQWVERGRGCGAERAGGVTLNLTLIANRLCSGSRKGRAGGGAGGPSEYGGENALY